VSVGAVNWFDFGLFVLFCGFGLSALLIGVSASKGIRARIERQSHSGGNQTEMEALRARVAELEERLDFAERLLAQHREPASLPKRAES
jgi:hypothetical protein